MRTIVPFEVIYSCQLPYVQTGKETVLRTSKLTRRQSEILLAAVISARATSMLFSKIVLAGILLYFVKTKPAE